LMKQNFRISVKGKKIIRGRGRPPFRKTFALVIASFLFRRDGQARCRNRREEFVIVRPSTEIIECAPLVWTRVWVTLCESEDRNHIRPLAPYSDSIWQAFTDNTVAKGLSMYSVSFPPVMCGGLCLDLI